MSVAGKLLLLAVVGLLLLLAGGMYETVLQQPVSAGIAVQQLNNSEVGAAAMRSYSALRYLGPTVCTGAFVLFGMALFRKELFTSRD